jgi:hypothetical protein
MTLWKAVSWLLGVFTLLLGLWFAWGGARENDLAQTAVALLLYLCSSDIFRTIREKDQ